MASVIGNRNSNQDCLLVDDKVYSEEDCIFRYYEINNEKPQIFAIADGMGGEKFGEVASKMIINEIKKILESKELNNLDELVKKTIEAIQAAQVSITKKMNETNSVGGTTISVLLIHNGKFACLNVGDSPVYLIRNKKMILLSKIHTLAQIKRDNGLPKNKINYEDEHCLVQCIGSGGYDAIDYTEGEYYKGDIFSVMSDGITLNGFHKAKRFLSSKNKISKIKDYLNVEDNSSVITISI